MAWITYTCNINSKLAQVLIENSFENQIPIKELPFLVCIGVYCKMPSGNSFHNPAETEKLDEIEDNLFKFCSNYGNGQALYTHRIGTSGIREYFIYRGEKAEINKAVASLKSTYPTYKIETDTMNDDDWNEYRKYLGFIKNRVEIDDKKPWWKIW